MPEIDIILPGLFDRIDDWSRSFAPLSPFPILEAALARANRKQTDATGFEETLWRHYGGSSGVVPTLLSEEIRIPISGSAFHATPVHLEAGIADLILFPVEGVESNECKEIQDIINHRLLLNRGERLEFDAFGNGVLLTPEAFEVTTTPPSQLAGAGIMAHQASGKDALALHRLGTELQMLLHDAPFNQKREQQGKASINALWLWGGTAVTPKPRARHAQLIANQPLALACAAACDQPVKMLTEDGFDPQINLQDDQSALVVLDTLMPSMARDDIEAWQQALRWIENRWLEPLLGALHKRQFNRLRIYPCDGSVFEIGRRDRLKLWRRPRPLQQLT